MNDTRRRSRLDAQDAATAARGINAKTGRLTVIGLWDDLLAGRYENCHKELKRFFNSSPHIIVC